MDVNAVLKVAAELREYEGDPFGTAKHRLNEFADRLVSAARGGGEAVASVGRFAELNIANQDARFAIEGAWLYGYSNVNQPPEGHWLCDWWARGREHASAPTTPPAPAVRDAWLPISEAPKDGTPVRLANAYGEWIGKYVPVYQSGFKPENPWSSLMLNHEHMAKCCTVPTHFKPLSAAPTPEVRR